MEPVKVPMVFLYTRSKVKIKNLNNYKRTDEQKKNISLKLCDWFLMKTRFALLPGQLPHFRVLGGRFRPKPLNSAILAQQVKKKLTIQRNWPTENCFFIETLLTDFGRKLVWRFFPGSSLNSAFSGGLLPPKPWSSTILAHQVET